MLSRNNGLTLLSRPRNILIEEMDLAKRDLNAALSEWSAQSHMTISAEQIAMQSAGSASELADAKSQAQILTTLSTKVDFARMKYQDAAANLLQDNYEKTQRLTTILTVVAILISGFSLCALGCQTYFLYRTLTLSEQAAKAATSDRKP